MPELERPYSMLDLRDGDSVAFTVLRHERGSTVITPPHAPNGKMVPVLRVHVRPDEKPDFPHWYDITSTRLVAQLGAMLDTVGAQVAKYRITARGIPPKRYFSVERQPR